MLNRSENIVSLVLIILVISITRASEPHSRTGDITEAKRNDLLNESKVENRYTLRKDECPCENGKCVPENGKLVCKCNPEFGLLKDGVCKACDCGKNMNCTFKPKIITDGKKCICPAGYVVVAGKCKGGCRFNPCRKGICEDGPNKEYKCICPEGYLGDKCEIKDLCSPNPCENGGNCSMVGSVKNCTCPVPFSGPNCERTPCSRNPCKNGGTCTVTSTGFKCSCRKTYTGPQCALAPCNRNPCQNGGTCQVTPTGFNCSCRIGFGGINCSSAITPCTSSPCKNGGTCKVAGKDFQCACKTPYSGKTCETGPCSPNPCKNNGTCNISGTTYKCSCKEPFSGSQCEKDPCTPNPCGNNGTCNILGATYKCSCKKPFFGAQCKKDPCSDKPCLNNGECTISGASYKCKCPKPYSGDKCEIKDCHCENGFCVKENGDLKCVCNPEYGPYDEHECKACNCGKGANCTFDKGVFYDDILCICPKGYEVKGEKCIAIDPCLKKPCQNGGTCNSHEIEYKCICPPGYSGDNCEKDPCFSKPCINGGNCTVTGSSFKCACKKPFYGSKCENDPCTTKPCHNGGNCSVSGQSFKCKCKLPYFGDLCNNDPCTSSPCKNGGTCKVSPDSYRCECKEPFYGDTCEKKECSCENGKCIEANRETKCVCNPEYGPYKEGVCKACHCGPGANCTFDIGIFIDDIHCICPSGYKVEGEKCIPYVIPPSSPGTTSELPATTTETAKSTSEAVVTKSQTTPTSTTTLIQSTSSGTASETPSTVTKTANSTSENVFTGLRTASTTDATPTETETEKITEIFTRNTTRDITSTIPYSETTMTRTASTNNFNSTTEQSFEPTDPRSKPPTMVTNATHSTAISTDLTQQTNSTFESSTVEQLKNTTTSFNPDTTSAFVTFVSNTTTQTTSNTNATDDMNLTNATTPFPVNVTDTEGDISTSPTEVTVTTPITTEITLMPDYNRCEPNPCYNGGTCKMINHMIYCFCRYPYGGRLCREGEWCVDGWGASLCPHDCNFNFTTNIGRCVCLPGQLYNHNLKKCESVDMCPYMADQCKGKNEVCLNSTCQCVENYKRNDKNECVPNFCESKLNPCGSNTICEDVVGEQMHMRCSCEDGFTSVGSSCERINKCNVPGALHCHHVCNTSTETCDCLPGYKLLPDGISCEVIDRNATCTKDCGIGVCQKTGTDEECMCPLTHTWNGTTCVDLCTFNQGSGLCPGGKCVPDEALGFKCVCEGPYVYSDDNVTCQTKSMCYDGNGAQICAEKGATCWDDFSVPEGYSCVCPIDQAIDTDGKCKNKCDLKENQDHCINKQGTCSTDGARIKCVCPPLVTQDTEGNCNKLADFSYFVSFPLVRDKYISTQQSRKGSSNAETKEIVDNDAVAKDVGDTMKYLFGQYYDTLKVFKCSDSPTQNLLRCQIEVQFHYDPKDQKKIIQDEGSCTSKRENDTTCILPPRLMLQKSLIRPDMITEANPCAPAMKKIHCGPNAECSRVDDKTQNFLCTCSKGFRSYGIYYPFVDERTIVHRCEDIDECKEDPKACPANTKCSNNYGSYDCQCIAGYQPSDVTKDPKTVGCAPICSSKTCNNGKCDVSGKQFYCKCDAGYIGKYCDQPMHAPPTAEAGSMKIALIILSTMIIPFILFSVYIFIKYKTFKKSVAQSSYYDDTSSLTMNMMVPIDQREDGTEVPRGAH